MSINLKPINIYKEQEPYDVDVDNRPLLDIQDNISEIVSILESFGCYSEIAADPSSEPAGGFSPFTCACVYSNSLLVPINIAKPISTIDYSKYPIVLVLNYNTDTKTYGCVSFSANIKLSSKFASFVPGSEGRLLRVGPGGELVDQLYYDLAHAAKGYQALYVGKILTNNSISFGGNQVSVLGNNYYLAKNRNDTTSGLITVQRGNTDSNIIFKSININQTGSVYNFAEFVNTSSSPYSLSESPIPVYFSSTQLAYDQSTGIFTSPTLETYLNEVHFNTPSINSLTNSNQAYLTAGVNVRGLLDFNATNVIHTLSYSNNSGELTQDLSTKLIFTQRDKVLISDPEAPVGLGLPNKTKSIGVSISSTTNQPDNIVPNTDTNGITFGDFLNTNGAYFGGISDNSLDPAAVSRPAIDVDQLAQTVTGVVTSNIITDYSDGFTLLLASKSTTTTLSNIALQADGYINLSSTKGILTNAKTPQLDLELTSKIYVDQLVNQVKSSDSNKIPLTGTSDVNVTGNIVIDVSGNLSSNTNVFTFTGINWVDIASTNKLRILDAPGSTTFQAVYANSTPGNVLPVDTERFQLVNKEFLGAYVTYALSSGTSSFVTAGTLLAPAFDQVIYGKKTFNSLTSIISAAGDPGLRLQETGGSKVDLKIAADGTLSIDNNTFSAPVILERLTEDTDPDGAIVTKSLLDAEIASVSNQLSEFFFATWNHAYDNTYSSVVVGSTSYACSFVTGGIGGADLDSGNFASFFQSTGSGLKYIGALPAVFQVNVNQSWIQNLGNDQYRNSTHILVNSTEVAASFNHFDGPSGFAAMPGTSCSAVVRLLPNDVLVAGGKINDNLSVGVNIHHSLSIAKLG